MMTDFVSVQLSREELLELREALLMRAIVEDTLRQEEGLEEVGKRRLLEKVEQLALLGGDNVRVLAARLDEELWQHAWYAYTDEWAWFRAKQDAIKDLGSMASVTPADRIEELAHEKYHKKFDVYAQEIDMSAETSVRRVKEKKPRKK